MKKKYTELQRLNRAINRYDRSSLIRSKTFWWKCYGMNGIRTREYEKAHPVGAQRK